MTVAKHYEFTYFNVIPASDKRWFVQTKSTCTIIGKPLISASGLPGRRVEVMRAGIRMRVWSMGLCGGRQRP